MARPDKAAAVAELTESLQNSQATVLTEYRGLTVSQISELRTELGGDVQYKVVKNTLTRIAAKDAGVDGFDELLVGPSAVAFIDGDPVEAAKKLRTFAKDNPALVVKGGIMDGNLLSAEEVSKLADLESREVLLAKLAGAMKASMGGAAAMFAAPLSQSARVIDALRAKVEAEGPVAGAAGVEDSSDEAEASSDAAKTAQADAAESTTDQTDTPAEAPADAD